MTLHLRRLWCFVACGAILGCASAPTLVIRREAPSPVQSSHAPQFPSQRPFTVAVLPFARADDPLEPDLARIAKRGEEEVRWRVEREFAARPGFRVFDHAHAAEIVNQLAAQMSAAFDESASKQLGRLLPADAAVFGKVRRYGVRTEVVGPFAAHVAVAQVDFTLSLVELETGKLLWRASHRGSGRRFLSAASREFEVDLGEAGVVENPFGDKAALADVGRLADMLVKEALATLRLP